MNNNNDELLLSKNLTSYASSSSTYDVTHKIEKSSQEMFPSMNDEDKSLPVFSPNLESEDSPHVLNSSAVTDQPENVVAGEFGHLSLGSLSSDISKDEGLGSDHDHHSDLDDEAQGRINNAIFAPGICKDSNEVSKCLNGKYLDETPVSNSSFIESTDGSAERTTTFYSPSLQRFHVGNAYSGSCSLGAETFNSTTSTASNHTNLPYTSFDCISSRPSNVSSFNINDSSSCAYDFSSSSQSDELTDSFIKSLLSSINNRDYSVANVWLDTLLDVIDLLPKEIVREQVST